MAIWQSIAYTAGLPELYVRSACLGNNNLAKPNANKIAKFLDLSSEFGNSLTEFANKWEAASTVKKEPLQCHFQEIVNEYGSTLKRSSY